MSDKFLELDSVLDAEFILLTKRAVDIAGQKFGRLFVLGPIKQTANSSIVWRCQCDCGNIADVLGGSLRDGKTQSCGCYNRESSRERVYSHGMKGTRIYRIWNAMKARCKYPSSPSYENYGARGVSVCQQWQDSFEDFHFYVAQLPHFDEDGYSLDRIDNDGNYEPGNIKWSTRAEQSSNKRNNLLITFNGKTQCVAAWSREVGVPTGTIAYRIRHGWPIERALQRGQ